MASYKLATYNLAAVQAKVAERKQHAFTTAALTGGFSLGLTTMDMVRVVQNITTDDFYKTMRSEARPDVWQDVYRVKSPDGMAFSGRLYVKFTLANGHPKVVISFKEL